MRQRLITVVLLSTFSTLPASGEDWQSVLKQAQNDLASGNLDNAEDEFRQAETLLEAAKITGIDDVAQKQELKKNGICLVDCLVGISKVKDRKGDFQGSDDVYEMGLNTLQKMCDGGWKSHQYADYLPGIADLYDRHGKPEQTELAWQKVIEIRTTVAPKEDPAKMIAAFDGYSKFLRAHQRGDEAVVLENKITNLKYNQQ